jgi:hypothetical protein
MFFKEMFFFIVKTCRFSELQPGDVSRMAAPIGDHQDIAQIFNDPDHLALAIHANLMGLAVQRVGDLLPQLFILVSL